MIYQMKIYYGAMINGQAVYSLESSLDDCKTFPTKIDESGFKELIESAILNDGFNIEDFEIRYLTKKEYENRFDIENEKSTFWTVDNNS